MTASNQNATRVLHLFKTARVTFALAGVTAMFAFAPSARADALDYDCEIGRGPDRRVRRLPAVRLDRPGHETARL